MSGPVSAPTPSPERRDEEEGEHPSWPDGSPILLGQIAEFWGGEVDEPGGNILAGVVKIEPDEVTLWWDHEGGGRPYTAEVVLPPEALMPAFPPAASPDPRSPEDGAVERGERSEHERWFVIHVNQISALRFAEFPVERLARASVAACNCGPHQIRKTTTVTYTDHGELELVPATPANRATR